MGAPPGGGRAPRPVWAIARVLGEGWLSRCTPSRTRSTRPRAAVRTPAMGPTIWGRSAGRGRVAERVRVGSEGTGVQAGVRKGRGETSQDLQLRGAGTLGDRCTAVEMLTTGLTGWQHACLRQHHILRSNLPPSVPKRISLALHTLHHPRISTLNSSANPYPLWARHTLCRPCPAPSAISLLSHLLPILPVTLPTTTVSSSGPSSTLPWPLG